jgi:hypothetical protein
MKIKGLTSQNEQLIPSGDQLPLQKRGGTERP